MIQKIESDTPHDLKRIQDVCYTMGYFVDTDTAEILWLTHSDTKGFAKLPKTDDEVFDCIREPLEAIWSISQSWNKVEQ